MSRYFTASPTYLERFWCSTATTHHISAPFCNNFAHARAKPLFLQLLANAGIMAH